MKKIIFAAMSFVLGHASFAGVNNDSIPQEKWIIYLDSNLNLITDSSAVVYTRYTYFVKGKDIFPNMKNYIGKDFKLKTTNNSNKNLMLNGIYTWFDSKGRMSSQHTFKNGEYISIKEFDKKGRLRQYFDFTQKSECDPLSYCVYQYNNKNTSIKTFYIQKDENGNWPKTR